MQDGVVSEIVTFDRAVFEYLTCRPPSVRPTGDTVAGAVATSTHGSGDTNASLATAVAGLTLMDGSGASRTVRRGDPDHDGTVVGLGALGIVTTLTLEVEPAFDVRQDVWTDLPYAEVADHFDEITASGYSVSLFTDFSDAGFAQAWVKSRAAEAPTEFFGARPATKQLHPDIGAVAEGVTQQGGIVGPWLERLPHFRLEFTPSHGAELQGEYLVPRARALDALDAFRSLRPRLEGLLRVSELRTVAADDLWLSSAYGTDVVGFHLTWVQDEEAVYAVLPDLEAALLPLGARPPGASASPRRRPTWSRSTRASATSVRCATASTRTGRSATRSSTE